MEVYVNWGVVEGLYLTNYLRSYITCYFFLLQNVWKGVWVTHNHKHNSRTKSLTHDPLEAYLYGLYNMTNKPFIFVHINRFCSEIKHFLRWSNVQPFYQLNQNYWYHVCVQCEHHFLRFSIFFTLHRIIPLSFNLIFSLSWNICIKWLVQTSMMMMIAIIIIA